MNQLVNESTRTARLTSWLDAARYGFFRSCVAHKKGRKAREKTITHTHMRRRALTAATARPRRGEMNAPRDRIASPGLSKSCAASGPSRRVANHSLVADSRCLVVAVAPPAPRFQYGSKYSTRTGQGKATAPATRQQRFAPPVTERTGHYAYAVVHTPTHGRPRRSFVSDRPAKAEGASYRKRGAGNCADYRRFPTETQQLACRNPFLYPGNDRKARKACRRCCCCTSTWDILVQQQRKLKSTRSVPRTNKHPMCEQCAPQACLAADREHMSCTGTGCCCVVACTAFPSCPRTFAVAVRASSQMQEGAVPTTRHARSVVPETMPRHRQRSV